MRNFMMVLLCVLAIGVFAGCKGKEDAKPAPAASAPAAPAAAPATPAQAPATAPAATVAPKADAKAATAFISYDSARLKHVRANGLPAKYAGMSNPVPSSEASVSKGSNIFKQQCVLCHGVTGRGDGPGGKSLKPPATDLISVARTKEGTDAYLFWAMTEGGSALKTSMPTFKHIPEEGRWMVVNFLRSEVSKAK
ncbi:MAG: c-type cytochrome [Deltaproteobacteria bacterium]|nr:c-type cytochrome [Deltaproteobacteria bacterium]